MKRALQSIVCAGAVSLAALALDGCATNDSPSRWFDDTFLAKEYHRIDLSNLTRSEKKFLKDEKESARGLAEIYHRKFSGDSGSPTDRDYLLVYKLEKEIKKYPIVR